MDNARFKTFTIHYIINNEWHKRIYDDTFLIHSTYTIIFESGHSNFGYTRFVTSVGSVTRNLSKNGLSLKCFFALSIWRYFSPNIFKTRKALFNLSIKPKTILRGYPFSTTKVSYNQQQQRSTCFNYCRHLIDIDTWGRKLRDHRDLALIVVF